MKYIGNERKNLNPDNVNMVYGVNVSDKEAVKKKMAEMRRNKAILTFISLIIIAVAGYIVYDFWNVSFNEGNPVVALKGDVDSGTKYTGIGYVYIECNDGKIYLNEKDDICNPKEVDEDRTFDDVLHDVLLAYLNESKIINDNFGELTINSYNQDSDNNNGGYDYFVDLTYTCDDGGHSCFKTLKDKSDKNNLQLYVSLDKTNTVYNVFTFKSRGTQYDKLKEDYKEKVKQYLIDNNKYVEDNVRYYDIKLVSNEGKSMFGTTTYEDCYVINISYMCNDNGNSCITAYEDGENNNLSFKAKMFLDEDNEVKLIESILAVN